VALVHSIGRRTGPGITQPWIAKYIFPGGYIPALSEMTAAIEEAGLWITDVEIKRLHYAETLKAWRGRFLAQWDEIAAVYDERFCRMWETYLALSELSFRYGANMVIQVQLAKRVGVVPIVRDYMVDGERATASGTGRSKPRSVA
jgi:cyclopropane-fatty-acyl-phospholipid synthase